MHYQMTIEDLFKPNKYVRRISYDEVKPFLLNIHYARRIPCITDAFGLFVQGELIGVVTYGVPASPSLCVGLAGAKNKDRVRELNRLVILPEYNGGNYASYLVGQSLKMLDNYTFVVSYADTAWGILDISIKQQIGFTQERQKNERTYIPRPGIQDTTTEGKQGDNSEVQNTDIYTLWATGGHAKRCYQN